MSAKGGLGRGLSALIPTKKSFTLNAPPAAKPGDVVPVVPPGERILRVPIGDIVANPYQPRREFHAEELEELVSSIKEFGVIQPIIVTEKENGMYELIAGERRLRASKAAGLRDVPAIVRSVSAQKKLELALIENVQRADLSPIEEARAYAQLMDEFGLIQEQVANRVGKSRPAVANTLRLLNLPEDIQRSLSDGEISTGMARVLVGMTEPAEQRAMFERMKKGEWTVRAAEAASRESKAKGGRRVRATSKDVTVMAMEEELRGVLGTRVKIEKKDGRGKIIVEYYSDEELAELVGKMRR